MRLILHAGAEYAESGAVRHDLVAARRGLTAAGVVLPDRDDAASWGATCRGLVSAEWTAPARALLAAAREAGAETIIASSDIVSDALTSPRQCAQLAAAARREGLDITVVVVVREQIGYLNTLYCRRVLSLDTARSFTQFIAKASPAHRFDYVASFGSLADTEGIRLAAVPYPDVVEHGSARSVLDAAGVPDEVMDALPDDWQRQSGPPGPVLIGAVRLLHKRLRRQQLFEARGPRGLLPLVDRLRALARAHEWDTTAYWGWDPTDRRDAMRDFEAGNEAFAQFVWGTPWPEQWSTGRPERVDLPALNPPLLREVITTVESLVDSQVSD